MSVKQLLVVRWPCKSRAVIFPADLFENQLEAVIADYESALECVIRVI